MLTENQLDRIASINSRANKLTPMQRARFGVNVQHRLTIAAIEDRTIKAEDAIWLLEKALDELLNVRERVTA